MRKRKLITNDDIAAFNAYCKQLSKGWVRNRLGNEPFDKIKGDKFAVIIPEFENNEIILKGSITWGCSGFSFLIKANSNKENKSTLRITRHSNCDIKEELINECINSLIELGKKKVAGRENTTHEKFKEPMLKALKKSQNISQRSRDNIEHFRKNNVFDKEFSTFLLKHESDGIRCCKSQKKC